MIIIFTLNVDLQKPCYRPIKLRGAIYQTTTIQIFTTVQRELQYNSYSDSVRSTACAISASKYKPSYTQ